MEGINDSSKDIEASDNYNQDEGITTEQKGNAETSEKNQEEIVEEMMEESKQRMTLLLEARHLDSTAAFSWAQEQIWNESVGFIKRQILRYGEFGQDNYHTMMNEAAIELYNNIDKYNSEKGTLTTFLTPLLKHCFSSVYNREIYKSSDYFSSNMMKVERAKKYFRDHDIPDPTKSDIASYTNLSIAKVEDALDRISAKNMLSIDVEGFESPAAETGNPETEALKTDRKESLTHALSKLSAMDYKIIVASFDLYEQYGQRQSDSKVAKMFNIRPDEVRKSIRRSLQILHADYKLASICKADYRRTSPTTPSRRTIITNEFFDDDMLDDWGEGLTDYNKKEKTDNPNDEIKWN